ncbi:oligoendopeptidase F [Wansuia hejianensis]|uniref:Oligopeptidase F n=1 Tax=Wansuia hejianensis TaxID=2763667 RepID=A0A926ETK5_9FIRM|nr:oligoendopeptidase F [Wansuia hejianensis]MBC8589548.1 oligoendopeptidase F [Wansuia hejianensis]
MAKGVLERKDIPQEDTWDLESMFSDTEAWENECKRVEKLAEEFPKHLGSFTKDANSLLKALEDRDNIYRAISNIYSYAHMKLDVDTTNSQSQSLNDKATSLYVKVEEKTSFLVPELLKLREEDIERFLEDNETLKLYDQHLKNIMRQKDHVLSAREESILAQMGEVGGSPEKIYSMLNDADLKFPTIKDEKGKDVEITQGNFIPLMESKNRRVRKDAFKSLYKVYKSFENTFAATLNGDLKNNIFNSRIRNYNSTREASLNQNNIPLSVYDNLIKSVHENLDSMYKYMNIRKRALELDELHMYDLYTPIVDEVDFNIPYKEGVELIKRALSPLGEEYLEGMNEGFNSRWIDIYENRGKRSGAYSGGSYDSKPFILLNYHDTLDNVFTVAHEMGHSMHSYFTRKNQPFIYGNYSIFVAEVASTANEALLLDYMIKNVKDKNEKLYLINHYLESFRTTVFRQTMFAEFEMIINEYLEKGGALTAEYLCKTYKELNKLYYGPDVIIDEEIAIEWARIPHFYYNFYVFQYATGFSAAISLSQQILENREKAVEKYLGFLKSGSSDYPINVLKIAGVDMTTVEPVNNAMKLFSKLVDELDKLI